MGFEEAKTKLKVKNGKRAVVRPDKLEPEIWELKTTPHSWRFYFHPAQTEKFIIYTHAVYKTQQHQDPDDVVTARNNLRRLGERTARRQRFNFTRDSILE
jgi:hypothetical protein